ncbi:ATP-dependent RNA helicase-like protein DB10 isoform X2 [Olea europaea var. sylvestris]|nr:ATP-dependent RNA helicase-like protein DB10 isoform X2 [Olea europaea var. sylvestris]XP_022855767.1 ATP-dependent RNA helicase-like protein DB10 isoform X2 [Olea europaea var. sylvestris]XP_022855768.1 ATP-dependent RNA helicase-like protein DB10 isoform X2 [Olea europaea var. sylvestris]
MAATATASSTGVRYAPDDPSLPKPWRALVDGKTGYLYFWNPETNVTQYERPAASLQASSGPPYNSLSLSVQKSSPGCHSDNDGDHYSSSDNGGSMKLASGAGSYQTNISRLDGSHDDRNVKMVTEHGSSASKGAPSGLSPEVYCRQHEISVIGDNVPQPFISFEATGLPTEILKEVYQAGFSAPTPIQAQSWPIALQGRDIVAIAKTGSGKTLGYLIPGFIHLKQRRNNPKLGPTVLVLSPTRELATQIQDEAVKFGKSSKISCTCLYGGAPKGPQLKELDRGLIDVVIATPGRLNDILEMGRISLHQISYLVLDEADRMLDMGFEPQIRKIVKNVPTRRQTLMYTATWPKEVRKIASDLLVRPVQVNIGNVDELVANKAITQNVEVLSPMEKRRRLEQILRSQEPGSKIIIFCSTKRMCDQLAGNLNHQFGADAIHGDKSQSERDHVLSQFRTGRTPVLVATDVAARGLDIKDIRVVINYDFPTGIEDYVHRIGRTGRAGATGLAYTFFSDQDAKHALDLVKILEVANQQVPVEIRDMASRGGGFGGTRRQWGSGSSGRDGGRGGRCDSGYGGRDGGRGGSYGYDHDQQDRYGYGSHDAHDGDAPVLNNSKSFHESMMANRSNTSTRCSRSRSPNKNSSWGENLGRARSRSRSRSAERFDTIAPTHRSFHEMMMEQARTSVPHSHRERSRSPSAGNRKETFGRSHDGNDKQMSGRSPGQHQGTEELANGPSSNHGEEEEGPMIPVDGEDQKPQDD